MSYYDVAGMTGYIRKAAVARGIDPDKAVRVARSEGLKPDTWQSNVMKGSHREPSYGPFQLLVGGDNPNFPSGMGDAFKRSTGLDPSDPKNAYATVDFALDQAVNGGWSPWYGAKAAGITGRSGIGPGAKALGVNLNHRPNQNPGAVRRGMLSDENLGIKPLDPAVGVDARPSFDVADTPPVNNVNESVDFGGMFKGMNFDAPGIGKGLTAIASALGGGGGSNEQAQAHAQPIQSSLPATEASDAQRTAAAQALMGQLMDKRSRSRLRPPGLSLMG